MAFEDVIASAKVAINYNEVDNANRAVDRLGNTAKTKLDPSITKAESGFSKLNHTLGILAGTVATIGVARLGNDIIQASTKMDTLNRMLVYTEKSQAAANKRFNEFRILAKDPAIGLPQISKAYVGLKSVNIEADLSIKFMRGLANSMAQVGAGSEEFGRVMEQIQQMVGKGKLVGQDLRVIAESFPQIRKFLADAFGGITDPEELAKSGITAKEVLVKLSAEFEKMPKFAGGAKNSFDNFHDSLMLFEASLGKAVLPTVTKLLDGLTGLMDKFNEMPESTKSVIGWATMGGLGGAGLIGIASVLMNVVNLAKEAKIALGAMNAVNIGTSAMAGAKGAGIAAGVGAGKLLGGSPIVTLAVATMTVGSIIWAKGQIEKAWKESGTYDREGEFKKSSEAGTKFAQEIIKELKAKGLSPETTRLEELDVYWQKQYEGTFGSLFPKDYSGANAPNIGGTVASWLAHQGIDISQTMVEGAPTYGGIKSKLPSIGKFGEIPIDYSGMPKAGEYSDPYANTIYSGEFWSKYKYPTHGMQLPHITGGNVPYDYRYPNEPITGVQVARGTYTTPSDMPSMRGGVPRDFTLGTGGMFGGQVSEQLQAESKAIENINADLDKQASTLDNEISKSAKQIAGDWEDIGGWIGVANKKQSIFWQNLETMGLMSMDRVIDKGIDQMFDHLFQSQETAISAWNDYGHRTGATWDQFEAQWEASNQRMAFSWKDFTIELASDWAKMLAKMEAESQAKDLYSWLTKSGGDNQSLIGKGVSWLANHGENSEEIPGGAGTGGGGTWGKIGTGASIATIGYQSYQAAQDYEKATGKQGYVGIGHPAVQTDLSQNQVDKLYKDMPMWQKSFDAMTGGWFFKKKLERVESYDSGGISYRPQMYYAGVPEAHIPLQGGKVPVNINSGGGGGNYTINISFPNADPTNIDPIVFKNRIESGIKMLVNEGKLNKVVTS